MKWYDASVNAVNSITLTAVLADAGASLQVRINSGSYSGLTSGAESSALPLNAGANTIDVQVTALDGTSKIYTIVVTKTAGVLPGITFNALPQKQYGDAPFVAGATSTLPYQMRYKSSNANVARISSSGKIIIRMPGTVTITAWQKAGKSYAAPAPVAQTLLITKGSQAISFVAIAVSGY